MNWTELLMHEHDSITASYKKSKQSCVMVRLSDKQTNDQDPNPGLWFPDFFL